MRALISISRRSRCDRAPQFRQHVFHERRPAGRFQHQAADPVLPEGRAALRIKQRQPVGNEGSGRQEVRGTVPGIVGREHEERGAVKTEVVRHEARASPGRWRATRFTGKVSTDGQITCFQVKNY